MRDEQENARSYLVDALDDAADLIGVPGVMAWCIEWERIREEQAEAESKT